MSDDPDRQLQILCKTFLSEIRSDQPDLNLRQLAVLLVVYQTDELQTVRGLAKHLNISKPAVTRALDRLGEFGLVRREIDPKDRRSVLVQRTAGGAVMVRRLEAAMAQAVIILEPRATGQDKAGL
ncbi:MarR family transcriptional regulator [Belnapia rosea]|uniref:DNA-binding transcriptional regulator, MarR family n=1 Tax=Belnapia rosea TaxID=938405 RepID=A0A1G7CUV5_9PROT|nr:MarR family transcriptional regulator [Belnapia rosea]SDE42426.1 DNA-binding transcriptional regulator, MarR family [Belnapia rosea]